jgi:hypothetical protein
MRLKRFRQCTEMMLETTISPVSSFLCLVIQNKLYLIQSLDFGSHFYLQF